MYFVGNSGRKKLRSANEIEALIISVDQHHRQTLRSLEALIPMSKTAILKHMAETKQVRARSSWMKPFLTPENVRERLKIALDILQPRSDGIHSFANMYDYVHIDKMWFNLTKAKKKIYVYDEEEVALRSCKSKRLITKVMFLSAVARPRYDANAKRVFDGKIGIWPFVEESPAARTTKNRQKGAMVTKYVSVDLEIYSDMIINQVILAFTLKIPRATQRRGVTLRQDNATPHWCVTTEMLKARRIHGLKVAN
ncbi:Aste57867_3297 [Aphanomyces stellatus]|uniref:Aste57867_3297 protein n=1 Tax=Aphanomyces stellatus TaxID=120398 RepID=A0A485KF56_9STRA|nr:hypothetical protein As57867_003287 [Aphanomyces stellatus]VFT80467.1 Aste57867_3297 [Aphanomyces stellatus]